MKSPETIGGIRPEVNMQERFNILKSIMGILYFANRGAMMHGAEIIES